MHNPLQTIAMECCWHLPTRNHSDLEIVTIELQNPFELPRYPMATHTTAANSKVQYSDNKKRSFEEFRTSCTANSCDNSPNSITQEPMKDQSKSESTPDSRSSDGGQSMTCFRNNQHGQKSQNQIRPSPKSVAMMSVHE